MDARFPTWNRTPRRYRLLRDYLLLIDFIRHIELLADDSNQFVLGTTFHGLTLGEVLETLDFT